MTLLTPPYNPPMNADGSHTMDKDGITPLFPENQVFQVPMEAILSDSDFNVRGSIAPQDVYELAREIKKNGLLQPITLQPRQDGNGHFFRIVAGHRRFEAHRINGASHVNALIKNKLSDLEARVINLSENIQRADLRIDQESKAINFFLLAGWNNTEIARRVGKTGGWVRTRKAFLELPRYAQDDVVSGLIPQAEIEDIAELGQFGEEAQLAYVKKVKDTKLLGKKRRPDAKKIKEDFNTKRVRGQDEIFSMQEAIQQAAKINDDPLAVVLGWAAGIVDNERLERVVTEYVRMKYERHFIAPMELV